MVGLLTLYYMSVILNFKMATNKRLVGVLTDMEEEKEKNRYTRIQQKVNDKGCSKHNAN